MPGPLLVKVRYDAPSMKDAAAHAVYVATRVGTDLTVTPDSLARMASREVSDDATYTRYIAERPGVVDDGAAHGLFDDDGVPDLAMVTDELAALSQSPVYRVIVSVNRADAQEIGLDSKAKWEDHVRAKVNDLSRATGIPRDNVRWVAAHHNPPLGHPHVHIMLWDKTDSPGKRVITSHGGCAGHIPAPRLKALRNAFTRRIYGTVRESIYEAKAQARFEATTFSKTSLSLSLEERRRIGAGASPDVVSGLTRDLDALSRMLPGRGRAAYKYLRPDAKLAVDRIVDKLASAPALADRISAYADAAVELKRHHSADPEGLAESRANAVAEVRARITPEVVQAAATVQRLRTAEGIIRTAPLVTRAHLLQGAPETVRTFYARALLTAGIDEDTAVGVMRKACLCDEPIKTTATRVATVYSENQPLRPSEWAAWRTEMGLPELAAGLQQTQATLHLLERTAQQLSLPSAAATPELARIDWSRLGGANRSAGRERGRGMTLDPSEGLSS